MSVERFEFRKVNCSYCATALRPTFYSRKKQVPRGSLDLNIQESVLCFQCPNCNGIKEDELITCDCGQVVDKYLRLNFKQISREGGFSDSGKYESQIFFGCPKCIQCHECKQPILINDVFSDCTKSETPGVRAYSTIYYHKDCYHTPERHAKEMRDHEEFNEIRAIEEEKFRIEGEKLELSLFKVSKRKLRNKKIEDFFYKISIPTAILSFIGLVACTQLDNQYILFYLIASNTCRILFLASMGLIVKNEERMFGLFSLAASNLSLVLTVLAFTTDPHNNWIRLLLNLAGFLLGIFTLIAFLFGVQSFFSSFYKKK